MAANPKPIRKKEKSHEALMRSRPMGFNKEHKRKIEKAHKKGHKIMTIKAPKYSKSQLNESYTHMKSHGG